MVSGKEDLLRALIEAYLMEKGTHEFYATASSKAVNAEARKTFDDLSAWEERHMEFIRYLYQSIEDDRDVEGFERFKDKTPSPVTEAGIPVKDLEERIERYSFVDDLGAVNLALEIEGKAFNFYKKLAEGASDSNAGVVFREMMEQEVKHVEYLKEMRKKVAAAS